MSNVAQRKLILSKLQDYFSTHFSLPVSYFPENTKLSDLLFDNMAKISLGKYINDAHWTNALVRPMEMAQCATIGDIADLLVKKEGTT